MRTRLLNLWELVRTSLWFIPLVMVVLAIGLSYGMIAVDRKLAPEPHHLFTFLYAVGPEGAREVLSTIAGSMITVAGVAFSITIVALTLASSEFGPHLLRNFMKDKSNQLVLGTFIATFIYCLLILRTVRSEDESTFVPAASVTFAIVLALVNVGVLIYFVHHISVSIQADAVITAVYRDLLEDMQRLFPEELGQEPPDSGHGSVPGPAEEEWRRADYVAAPRSGYLQAIDGDGLLEIAREFDLVMHVAYRPGEYVSAGNTLATIRCGEKLDGKLAQKIAKCFIVGSQRTPEQDVEFGIHQLVEVAMRALSPSINSPFTAISCVDRLGSVLCFLTRRAFPSPYRYDRENKLRVIARPTSFRGITNAAFDQIRQHGRSNAAVMVRLLDTLQIIAVHARTSEQKRAIRRQADMIVRSTQEALGEDNDRQDVRRRYEAVVEALEQQQSQSALLSSSSFAVSGKWSDG